LLGLQVLLEERGHSSKPVQVQARNVARGRVSQVTVPTVDGPILLRRTRHVGPETLIALRAVESVAIILQKKAAVGIKKSSTTQNVPYDCGERGQGWPRPGHMYHTVIQPCFLHEKDKPCEASPSLF
jgi:hypothetical protein